MAGTPRLFVWSKVFFFLEEEDEDEDDEEEEKWERSKQKRGKLVDDDLSGGLGLVEVHGVVVGGSTLVRATVGMGRGRDVVFTRDLSDGGDGDDTRRGLVRDRSSLVIVIVVIRNLGIAPVLVVVASVVLLRLVAGPRRVVGILQGRLVDVVRGDPKDLDGLASPGPGADHGEFDVLANVDGIPIGGVEDVEAVDEEVITAVRGFQGSVVGGDEAPPVGRIKTGDRPRHPDLVKERFIPGGELSNRRPTVVLVFVGDDVLDEADNFKSLRSTGLGLDPVIKFNGVPGP